MFAASSISARLEGFRRAFSHRGGAIAGVDQDSFQRSARSGDDVALRAERVLRLATAAADRRLAGRSFGGFRLIRVLGQGRFGTGFLAMRTDNPPADRPQGDALVFMKLVKPRGGEIDRAAVWAECVALSLCDHPGVPRWMGIVNEGGRYFIVESLVAGAPLASLLSSGRVFSQGETASVGRSLIELAAHMAGRGVVHNDIRPANVLIAPERPASLRVGLVDFGLAEFFDRGTAEDQAIRAAGADVAGVAETIIHMLYSDRMRVRSQLSRTAPWFDALLISSGQRRLLLDMFEGRIESYGTLLERFDAAFGALAPRLPFFGKVD